VFVIGYLGDWQRAAEVLFESESVCRNPAPSREKRQDVAGTIAARFGISRNNHEECVAQTLLARRERFDLESETPVVAPTLQANDGAKWGSNQWIDEGKAIVQPIGFGAQMSNPQTDVDLMQTLNAKNPMAVAQPTYGIPGNWIGRQPENGGNAVEPMHDVSPCLTKTDRHGVAQPYVGGVDYENNAHTMDEPTGPLLKGSPTGGGRPLPAIATAMQVRRLTPVECERLQGFPDNYTNIPWRKSAESPDGPRYKALGNSMAVPVMRWIGERINKMEQR
jgi:site-specific DNA-cytosine methylase